MAKTAGSGPLYEVRRDIDLGVRTLKRGARISLEEIERLAPGKSGPLRRTGIVRPVDGSDRDEMAWRHDSKKERLHTANRNGLKQTREVTDEQ